MRQVIWNKIQSNKSSKDDYYAVLHDALFDELEINSPTDQQIKKLYDFIPMNIVYNGAAYGFGDTCVREELHEFIRFNLEKIKEHIK